MDVVYRLNFIFVDSSTPRPKTVINILEVPTMTGSIRVPNTF